jgi:hypothetical protein
LLGHPFRYTLAGFDVKAVAIREDGKAIDRVNMFVLPLFWTRPKHPN